MKKKSISILMSSLLLIAYSSFAQSTPASDRNLILTEGTSEVLGQNDSAKISIAVVNEGRNLDQVGFENDSKTKAVLKAVKSLGIEKLKLKTTSYRVTPQKDYKVRPPKIKGYEVYNAIEVMLEGLAPEQLSKQVSKIVGKALDSGANKIQHINFYIKNKEGLEKEALRQATRKAMQRARTLAETAGVKLKHIVSLSTHPIQMPPRPHFLRSAEMKTEADAMTPPIEIGESQVRVRVSIAYEIEP